MIRIATQDDLPRIVELGRTLHATSSYASLSFDDEKVASLMAVLIDGAGVVFVAEQEGLVIGGIAGGVTEHWFSKDKVAFDYSFFIDPKHRHGITAMKIASTFMEWARLKGATQVRMGITTEINVEGTSRLYRALGFESAGVLFKKEI